TVTIVETDPPPTVQFASATQSVNENGSALTVTVNLTGATTVPATIPITLGGTAVLNTDYKVSSTSLTINAGQTSATFTVTPINDGYSPANKTVTLNFGSLANAQAGATSTDTVTIVETDPPPTVQFASATQSVNENGSALTVTVNLTGATTVPATIPITLGGTAVLNTDYKVSSTSLTFSAGQTSATFTV